MREIFRALDDLYTVSKMYLAYIPLYPAGMWFFALASKGDDPLSKGSKNRVEKGLEQWGNPLKYYNASVHTGCFAPPKFVSDIIK